MLVWCALQKCCRSSCWFLKGNTFHPGLALKDANATYTCGADTTEYHAKFVKKGYSLPKSIMYLPDPKPSLLQPSSTSQDELVAIMDTVCYKSPAVEEAGSKAPAERRPFDEPAPGNPAAPTQHAGSGSRARQPARSFKPRKNSQSSHSIS